MLRIAIALGAGLLVTGCASAPTGPEFARAGLPAASADKVQIIVFRDYAEPTALAAKIDVDSAPIAELPQKSFAYFAGAPGKHTLGLKWPSLSGTPGWNGDVDWTAGQTYYYQLSGTAGNGFYFHSSLAPLDEQLAITKLNTCCRLVTSQKSSVTEAAAPKTSSLAAEHRALPLDRKAVFFASVAAGMTTDDVVKAIGAPDEVSSKATGKRFSPFYYGSDTRREIWSYSGIGYVVFTRNEYSASVKVVETKYDTTAP